MWEDLRPFAEFLLFGGILVASALDGLRFGAHPELVSWLNRTWPYASPGDLLSSSPLERTIAGTLRGYPVLVDVEPSGADGGEIGGERDISPRVVIYVAALGSAPGDLSTQVLAAFVRDCGFALSWLPDVGLVARAVGATLDHLRRQLHEVSLLGPVVEALVRLAEANAALPASGALA